MKTRFFTQEETKETAQLLEAGGIVAIPTDTVYGLAVLATNQDAINHLKKVKNRPQDKAFAYMVDSLSKISDVCELSDRDLFMIEKFLPGPLTLIFNKKKNFPLVHESQLNTLAVRIPDHPFVLELIKRMEFGLYVPSANRSNEAPAIHSDEVRTVFENEIDGIVIGQAFNTKASTVIDCSQKVIKCIREGAVSFREVVRGVSHYE